MSPRPAPCALGRRNRTCNNVAAFQPTFEIFSQSARRAIPRTWLSLQTFRADRLQIPIQPWHKSAQLRRRFLARLLNHLQRVLTQKWRTTRQQIEQNRTQTVNVSRRSEFPCCTASWIHLLWCHVMRRAKGGECPRQVARRLKTFSKTKIANQRFAPTVEQNVPRFQ